MKLLICLKVNDVYFTLVVCMNKKALLETDKLYCILQKMRNRVSMYVCEMRINNLMAFIIGYQMALRDFSIANNDWFNDFQNFVIKKFNYNNASVGIVEVILAHCLALNPNKVDWDFVVNHNHSDEVNEKAIQLFYELLDEFSSCQ